MASYLNEIVVRSVETAVKLDDQALEEGGELARLDLDPGGGIGFGLKEQRPVKKESTSLVGHEQIADLRRPGAGLRS